MSWDLLQGYEGEEVVLLGEVHTEERHKELEEEAAYRLLPRYVLSEGFDNAQPEELEEFIGDADLTSLRDFQTYFEKTYEDSQFLAEGAKELLAKTQDLEQKDSLIGRYEGKIPESYNKLLDTPFYLMDKRVIDLVKESIKERRTYEKDERRKWKGEELANGLDDEKIQDLYRITSEISEVSRMSKARGSLLRPVNNLRREGFEVEIAGCDLDKSEKYSSESDDGIIEEILQEESLEHRDRVMADRISSFNRKNDTGRVTMAVVGSQHIEGIKENLAEDTTVYSENLEEIAEHELDTVKSELHVRDLAENLRN